MLQSYSWLGKVIKANIQLKLYYVQFSKHIAIVMIHVYGIKIIVMSYRGITNEYMEEEEENKISLSCKMNYVHMYSVSVPELARKEQI